MRIIEMRPEITPWRDGQHRQVSSWSFHDVLDAGGLRVRMVNHYSTRMLEYHGFDDGTWNVVPVSVGHGSVSDQGGMNQLMGFKRTWIGRGWTFTTDYGDWVYRRDERGGGARIEHNGETVVD